MSSQRRHLSDKQGEESLRPKTTIPEFLSRRTVADNVNFTLRPRQVVPERSQRPGIAVSAGHSELFNEPGSQQELSTICRAQLWDYDHRSRADKSLTQRSL